MIYSRDGKSSGDKYFSKRIASSRAKGLDCCSTHWKNSRWQGGEREASKGDPEAGMGWKIV